VAGKAGLAGRHDQVALSCAHKPALEPAEPEPRVISVEVRETCEDGIEIGASGRQRWAQLLNQLDRDPILL